MNDGRILRPTCRSGPKLKHNNDTRLRALEFEFISLIDADHFLESMAEENEYHCRENIKNYCKHIDQ